MRTSMQVGRQDFYRSYREFKSWKGEGQSEPDHVYATEMARAGIGSNADILEIGFGEGHFLDWCDRVGHTALGIEIIPELVEQARTRGHSAVLGRLGEITFPNDRHFDLVVAFDVLEHLTVPEICEFLRKAEKALKPTGRILARFPNAASPFGAYYQFGDITHVTALSESRIEQLAKHCNFVLLGSYNAARSVSAGGRSVVAKRVAYCVRNIIERVVGLVYFGQREPLDPNLTVVLGLAERDGKPGSIA